MQLFDTFLTGFGWEEGLLIGALLLLLVVQLCYYLGFGRIARYKDSLRPAIREQEPPVSVIVPMFSEEYSFVEERLPLLLAQDYPAYEVVIVYVGQDKDFYEELLRLKAAFPQIYTSKILLDPRFPISRKMALNVGIKSAHYDCMVFTSTDACPQSERWLSLMAKGFLRGDIVLGYCGLEREKGFRNYFLRTWRMMHAVPWIARATRRRPYRGTLHNLGFTKTLYFNANGFGHLSMNIGEDDLFMQQVMTEYNVSVVLSPRAALREKVWGGWGWWLSRLRYFGASERLYPRGVRCYLRGEAPSRVLFFAAAVAALVLLPLEYKIAAALLLVLRFVCVLFCVRRIAKRLGEERMLARYLFYDLLSPFGSLLLTLSLLRKDARVWR